jgi:quercetin dioxygenase-like cupin family protein
MQSWDLMSIETPSGSRSPAVLYSSDEARAVLIGLQAGQALGEHEVKEYAFLVVVDGSVQVESGGETREGGVGAMFFFEPEERHSVSSAAGARVLLLLAPWPGPGHYRGGGE